MKPFPWRLTALACASLLLIAGPPPSSANAEPPELEEIVRFEPEGSARAGYATDLVGDYALYANKRPETVDIAYQDGPDPSSWSTVTLAAPEPDRAFGSAVALNEAADRAYVSSPRNQAIVVYARSGANDWVYEQSLAPPGLPERVSSVGNTFGESLALDGDRLLIGVPNARVDNQNNTGFAYLLDLGTESWTPLIPETPRANSITGQSVALSGDRAALSAVQVRNAARLQVGGVYLWDLAAVDEPRFTSQPEEDSRVCLSSAGSGPAFGMSLAFDAETLFVGSPREVNYTADDPADPAGGCLTSAVDQGNTTQGAVYRFTHELEQIGGKILPPAGSYEYGHNIAVSENALLANTQHAPEYEGEVIVTDISTLETAGTGDENHRQRPTPAQTLTASNPSPGASFGQQLFGNALTVDGTRALVGTPDANDGAGAVYVFQPISPNVTPVTLTGTDLTLEYGESGSIGAQAANATSEGTISAEIAGTALEAVETAGGEAQIALPPGQFDVGEYPIMLTFTPAGATEAVASTAEPRLTVAPAATETRLRAEPVPGGAAVTVSGTVTAAHGTRPGGAVTLLLGGVEVAEAILDAEGSFALPEPLPVAADATLDARYPGDGNHLASSAAEELLAPGITGPGTPPPTTPSGDPATPTTTPPPGPEPRTPLADTGAGLPWIIVVAVALLAAGGWIRRRSSRE